jgi:cystathionine beta-lyase
LRQFDEVTLEQLRRRRSAKWRTFPADVLPAFIAEMDYRLAPAIAAAVNAAVGDGDCGYAWPDAELGEAVAGFAARRYGWHFGSADVGLIPDVMAGVTELLRLAVPEGGGVVINTPVYPPFFSHIRAAGCTVVESPLARDGDGYALDLDALAHAFARGARVYLLCNPHNPTGIVLSRGELERIAELAERHAVLVFADEIHAPLVLPGAQHTAYLSLGESAAARGIAFVSASKGWNIPGLKCAQAVATSAPMRALIQRLDEDTWERAGNLGIVASIAAYRDSVEWLDRVVTALHGHRRLLRSLLERELPGVRYVPPAAGYLAWLDCRSLGFDREPVDMFLERGRVALGPGLTFGANGAGHVRITFATSEALLREIVARMAAALGASSVPGLSHSRHKRVT